MSSQFWNIALFGCMFVLLATGLPVVYCLGASGAIFIWLLWGPQSLYLVISQTWGAVNEFMLVALPLFIFMAYILERSNVAEDLYGMMYLWFGSLRGGLAIGTLVICTIFAAMCGISGTAVVTMGAIAAPSMLRRGYDKRLAIGCINSGGGWGILMPPSTDMILYALIAQHSVGALFAGGVLPTILLLCLDTIYIIIRARIQPHLAPALPPEERGGLREKIIAGKAIILPAMVIIMVLGSILFGLATPTEAASMGVVGSIISAFVNKKLSWKMVTEAAGRAFKITGMLMWVLFGSQAFSSIWQGMGTADLVMDLVQSIPGGRWGTVISFQLIIFILAMGLNPLAIMLITLPVFLPIVNAFGFDPTWFGILFIVNLEIGYMTPPFGFNLFYLKAVLPADISMLDIYRSVIPFTFVELTGLVLIMVFPEIATWLPSLLNL